ncbi:MAG TPA: PilN domain-containing protein [bacterium]|nr:PilN domain-containing protein [bacterium]
MRLRTNFSFPFEKLIPALTGLGWLGAVAGFFMAVVMAAGALQFQRENPGLKDELDQLQKNPVTESPRESQPSVDELDGVRRRLKDLNSLHAGGGASVTSLLAGLESILPPGARLLSLQQDQVSGEVQLVVEAPGLEELSRFLAALESDNSFSKVTLTKQSQSQGEKGNWIQFSVDLMEGGA